MMEVADFLKGSFLDPATSPIIPVSSRTGAGLGQLQSELARLAAETAAKDSAAVFRLPIDRVFTMKGFGTVVTGTLISGTVHKDQEIQFIPAERGCECGACKCTDRSRAGHRRPTHGAEPRRRRNH